MAGGGKEMMAALTWAQDFHHQVASLLETAEGYLVSRGLKGQHSTQALGSGSKSLDEPRSWMPNYAVRFAHPADPNVIFFVSVLMVARPGDSFKFVDFTEPLACSGWIRFPGPVPIPFTDWWWAKLPHWRVRAHDGSITRWTAPTEAERDSGSIEQAVLAFRLAKLGSSADLIERVVDPMIASFNS